MRAVVCNKLGSYQELVIEETPWPRVAPGTVRIRVAYASVSFAITLMVNGTYQRRSTPPFTPGTEVVGIVDAVADGVTHVVPGDRVAAIVASGGFADQVLARPETIYHIPAELPLDKALHIPLSYGTAYAGLVWRAGLNADDTVLIHGGAGAIGTAAIQIAAMRGAHVIATAGSAEKCAAAAGSGAAATINYREENFRDKVRALTDGRGADVIFDPVGGDVLKQSLRAAAVQGRIVIAGFAGGDIPALPANILLVKNLTLHGLNFSEFIGWGLRDRSAEFAPSVQGLIATLFEAAAVGQLAPVVNRGFSLEQVVAALDYVVSREAIGKVVLEVAP